MCQMPTITTDRLGKGQLGVQTAWHSSVHLLSHFLLCATPWTAARQASLSITAPGACLNSCPSSRWCHPTISSSVFPFSCLQSFPISARTFAFLFMYLFNVDHNGKLKYMFLFVLFCFLNSNDPAWPLLCCVKSILYICISIPALQLGSSVPFFWILHMC